MTSGKKCLHIKFFLLDWIVVCCQFFCMHAFIVWPQDLPDSETYWPPINIRCMECRSFGRELLVGICTLSNSTKYKTSNGAFDGSINNNDTKLSTGAMGKAIEGLVSPV